MSTSTTARRRQNSSAASSALRSGGPQHHSRQKSKAYLEPNKAQSAHVSDPFLQSFLGSAFSPADYLNATLPSLQTSTSSSTSSLSSSSSVPLAELSTQAQTQLTQLNAHTTRLTSILTQLTDDILRSGSRLAYEVELLRGEALSLSETLTDTLHEDVVKFVPGGLQGPDGETKGGIGRIAPGDGPLPSPSQRRRSGTAAAAAAGTEDLTSTAPNSGGDGSTDSAAQDPTADPAYISQLQTLTLVRSRLDTVVKTFGDAMEFVFPPSELSVSSSFLSVSAPEPGSAGDRSTEDKGQKVLRQLRDEIATLLNNNNSNSNKKNASANTDPVEGIEKAAHRIEELKDLATVWNGTAEEKGRTKFIDSLAKMVEDRHKELTREMEQAGRRDESAAGGGGESGHKRSATGSLDATTSESRGGLSGYGIMSQLQRLRTGL
ncbi:hypothetical protein F4808DRAFT_155651 [Astrocystis sublimbata]|nr:hypothetical protein F4808DRAFT_155651 [Astrocystis sublimbata]